MQEELGTPEDLVDPHAQSLSQIRWDGIGAGLRTEAVNLRPRAIQSTSNLHPLSSSQTSIELTSIQWQTSDIRVALITYSVPRAVGDASR